VRTVDDVWNHNLHYQSVLLRELPERCGSVLDVGCGQGFLLSHLAPRAAGVVGIDRHAPSLEEAARRVKAFDNVRLIEADAMTYDFGRSFDAVLSVAVVHHLPLVPGLQRMTELTAPGGLVGVIGLARSRSARDLGRDAIGALETRVRRLRRPHTMVTAPVCDPDESYADVRSAVREVLPGARYRRHNLFRYSITWRRPG
jgi:SAM-dependent methyltransferase